MGTDPIWCFENYTDAAECIDKLTADLNDANEFESLYLSKIRSMQSEIAKLRADLAAAKAEIEGLKEYHESYRESCFEGMSALGDQICARDLVIKQMRAALVRANHFHDYEDELALQPTTEALDEFVQRAVEQEKERIAALCDEFHVKSEYPGFVEFAAAIRGTGK